MKQNDAENTEERPQTQAEEEQRGRVLKVRATHVGTTLQCHPDWAGGMAGGWGTGGGGGETMQYWGDPEMLGMQGPEDRGPNMCKGFGNGLEWGSGLEREGTPCWLPGFGRIMVSFA